MDLSLQFKKECLEAGVWGRHPRGSDKRNTPSEQLGGKFLVGVGLPGMGPPLRIGRENAP